MTPIFFLGKNAKQTYRQSIKGFGVGVAELIEINKKNNF